MKIIDLLVEQCKKPEGLLGFFMTKTMNVMDAGLNKWILQKITSNQHQLLDVGCGGGVTIFRICSKLGSIKIEGIDYSAEAVKLSMRKNKKFIKQGKVNIRQGDVEQLPFVKETFDTVLAVRTHYFWPNLEKSLCELYRVLNYSGTLHIFSEQFKIKYHMTRYNTEESMKELLYKIGFKAVHYEIRNACICISAVK